MRPLLPTDHLPPKIAKMVDKARAAEILALAAYEQAQRCAEAAREASHKAERGEAGYWVGQFGDGYTYAGQWGKSTPHGLGRLDATGKGSVYYGQFHHAYFQGYGVFEFDTCKPQGSLRYGGKFWRDLRHGVGIYEWHSGARWCGELKMEEICGYGIYFYPNGKIFEGQHGGKPAHRHDSSQRDHRTGVEWQLDGTSKVGFWVANAFTTY